MTRRILVTGGSGFIGTNYVNHCIKRGDLVRIIDISPPVVESHNEHWSQISIMDKDALISEFSDFRPEFIVHLAARTDLDGESLNSYKVNFLGTKNVAEAAEVVGCKKIIFASTKLVNRNGYCPKDNFDYCPDTLYGESKVIGEKLLRDLSFKHLDWAIVRPTSIWGPWSDIPHIPYGLFFKMIGRGSYYHINGVKSKRAFGYVGNAISQIDALLFSEERFDGEVFYLVDYEITYIHEWAELIRKEYGSRSIRTIPSSVARVGAMAGDVFKFVTKKEFPLNSRRLKNMTLDTSNVPRATIKQRCPNLPFTQEAGVKETVAWFRSLT